MPLYDWKCSKCQREFESLASMGTLMVLCPECRGQADKKPTATKSYSIKGDNGASTTPKKHAK